MQNNKMLQARYRYLQARRDLEYKRLKEAELQAVKEVEVIEKTIDPDAIATCMKCGRAFMDKRGLSSHIRGGPCGQKKD